MCVCLGRKEQRETHTDRQGPRQQNKLRHQLFRNAFRELHQEVKDMGNHTFRMFCVSPHLLAHSLVSSSTYTRAERERGSDFTFSGRNAQP